MTGGLLPPTRDVLRSAAHAPAAFADYLEFPAAESSSSNVRSSPPFAKTPGGCSRRADARHVQPDAAGDRCRRHRRALLRTLRPHSDHARGIALLPARTAGGISASHPHSQLPCRLARGRHGAGRHRRAGWIDRHPGRRPGRTSAAICQHDRNESADRAALHRVAFRRDHARHRPSTASGPNAACRRVIGPYIQQQQ